MYRWNKFHELEKVSRAKKNHPHQPGGDFDLVQRAGGEFVSQQHCSDNPTTITTIKSKSLSQKSLNENSQQRWNRTWNGPIITLVHWHQYWPVSAVALQVQQLNELLEGTGDSCRPACEMFHLWNRPEIHLFSQFSVCRSKWKGSMTTTSGSQLKIQNSKFISKSGSNFLTNIDSSFREIVPLLFFPGLCWWSGELSRQRSLAPCNCHGN